MSRTQEVQRLLILGGGGMVGLQVAREAARELHPEEIILSALTRPEVDDAVSLLSEEARTAGWKNRFTAAPADIFLPESLQGHPRQQLLRDKKLFDELFADIFSSDPEAYKKSMLVRLIKKHRPDVIVDCINTATAISYQDVFTTSRKVKLLIDRLENEKTIAPEALPGFVESVRELLIAQGVPQIVRHIVFLHRALQESEVRVYVKVGTTGTGGMGINIPYTHSEDKPSATLLSKSAVGFAHTGLLFLLARTPHATHDVDESHGTIIKEIKPGAMIGFRRLGLHHVRIAGADGRRSPGFLLEPHEERLNNQIDPRESHERYQKFEKRDFPLMMVGADTGENGFFSIGEFQAVTYPRQMEYVTPEEVGRTVVLEILGASTGRDVLSAIDGAITEPSYRAGVLRHEACSELTQLDNLLSAQNPDHLPSIAVGHVGPPRLSKLLIEAFLIRAASGVSAFETLIGIEPKAMQQMVEQYLSAHARVVSLSITIGIPILRDRDGGLHITRGPRLNIPAPPPDGQPLAVDSESLERYAFSGWVDLRLRNFETWRERMRKLACARPDIAGEGSAAFSAGTYLSKDFVPGDVVGWILTNEVDDMGMVGHRLF